MSGEPLLLTEARSGVLIRDPRVSKWRKRVVIGLGIVTIVVGAADIASRFSVNVLGDNAPCIAFGPAIGALDPSLANTCNP